MHVHLYSGAGAWALTLPCREPPPSAHADIGPLILEAVVPRELFPDDCWRHLRSDIERDGYVQISEDLGLMLIEECMYRFGRLISSMASEGRTLPPRAPGIASLLRTLRQELPGGNGRDAVPDAGAAQSPQREHRQPAP